MTDTAHIETCATCGRAINALHRASYRQDTAGRYYHNRDACLPAHVLRAGETVLVMHSGNGLESR